MTPKWKESKIYLSLIFSVFLIITLTSCDDASSVELEFPAKLIINNATAKGMIVSISDDSYAINIPGVINSANPIDITMSYTVSSGSALLPAYSKTFEINEDNTQNNKTGIIATFSWSQQSNLTGSGTFKATITTSATYNAKQLDIDDEIEGRTVATFAYPIDAEGNKGLASLKVIPGIPDRMFGVADNTGDVNSHKYLYLPVVNATTGKTWLNNNLGAEYSDTTNPNGRFNINQQATSSTDSFAYGSLFQWGRKADGHELINWTSSTDGVGVNTTTDTNNNNPLDALFITESLNPFDWQSVQDDTLWANESGANNVCPIGYRLPTSGVNGTNMEWESEVNSWNSDNLHTSTTSIDAIGSGLKLPMTGRRNSTGSIQHSGSSAYYWSGSTSGANARYLHFSPSNSRPNYTHYRASGFSVRCIKN